MTDGRFKKGQEPVNKQDIAIWEDRLNEANTGSLEILEVYRKGKYIRVRTKCSECGERGEKYADNMVRGISVNCNCNRTKWRTEAQQVLAERYHAMVQRCNNPSDPNYKNYGGRGIKLKFESADDMVSWVMANLPHKNYRGVELDRIDNNGDYVPGNLRLASRTLNQSNTRTARRTTYRGQQVVLHHLWDLIKVDHPEFPLSLHTVTRLASKGMDPEDIIVHRRSTGGGRPHNLTAVPRPRVLELYRDPLDPSKIKR